MDINLIMFNPRLETLSLSLYLLSEGISHKNPKKIRRVDGRLS